MLAFPSGLRWDGLAAEQVGLAVALAAADNPGHVPLRDSERRVLDVRLVRGSEASRLQRGCGRDAWMSAAASLRQPSTSSPCTQPPPSICWPRPLQAPVPPLTLLVCCHAARDSRCDRLGLPLAAALQSLAAQRGAAEQVQVLATSHVSRKRGGDRAEAGATGRRPPLSATITYCRVLPAPAAGGGAQICRQRCVLQRSSPL